MEWAGYFFFFPAFSPPPPLKGTFCHFMLLICCIGEGPCLAVQRKSVARPALPEQKE